MHETFSVSLLTVMYLKVDIKPNLTSQNQFIFVGLGIEILYFLI